MSAEGRARTIFVVVVDSDGYVLRLQSGNRVQEIPGFATEADAYAYYLKSCDGSWSYEITPAGRAALKDGAS